MTTKRIAIVLILTISILVVSTYMANATLLTLLAFGQASIPVWRPIIPIPEIVDILKDGQLSICLQAKSVLTAQIARILSKPAGYMVSVSDPASPTGQSRVPKDDWLLEANAALTALNDHITLLETN